MAALLPYWLRFTVRDESAATQAHWRQYGQTYVTPKYSRYTRTREELVKTLSPRLLLSRCEVVDECIITNTTKAKAKDVNNGYVYVNNTVTRHVTDTYYVSWYG